MSSVNILSVLGDLNAADEPKSKHKHSLQAPEKKAFSSHLNQQGKALTEKNKSSEAAPTKTPKQDQTEQEAATDALEPGSTEPAVALEPETLGLALVSDTLEETNLTEAALTEEPEDEVPVLAVGVEPTPDPLNAKTRENAQAKAALTSKSAAKNPVLATLKEALDKPQEVGQEHPFKAVENQLKKIGQQLDKSLTLNPLGESKSSALEPLKVEALSLAAQSNNAGAKGLGYGLAASAGATGSLRLDAHVENQNWGQQFSQKITWMVKENILQANIRLNPVHLGPIEVKISTQNDQTSVNFTAQHALTRDAIEQALPKLKEMMAESGLNLAESDVSQESFRGETEPETQAQSSGAGR